MKDVRTIVLAKEDVEEAICEYVMAKTGAMVRSVDFKIGYTPCPKGIVFGGIFHVESAIATTTK